MMAGSNALKIYRAKRDFSVTSEPAEGGRANASQRSFVIQKHWATRLHFDFRLELDGTMKSWAVPKGPSFDSKDKRMAVQVEDHPIAYNQFEGVIPPGQYGAGRVIIWDKGIWVPLGDPVKGYRDGNLKFELHGQKLHGKWVLVRMKGKGEKATPWLLIKEKDEFVRPASEYSVVDELPDSVSALKSPPDISDKRDSETTISKTATTKRTAKSKTESDAGLPDGAVRSPLPATFKPQLATLVDKPPSDSEEWIYEIKFDGYRMLTRIDEQGGIRLFTRNGHDWSDKLPALVKALEKIKLSSCWLDGEIVVPNKEGVPDFQALQNAFELSKTKDIVYHLFDVPFYDGADLRGVILQERRAILKALLDKRLSTALRFSDTFEAAGGDIVASACSIGLEGVIGKRKTSTYHSRRSSDWIKLKCVQRQEFVIGGYTDPQGARTGIGSLLLGVHDENGALQYAGNVGTGFNQTSLREIRRALDAIPSGKSPFACKTDIDRKAHWVAPQLIAEVSFGEWTKSGHIRHSVFHGLRADKKAGAIVREKPQNLKAVVSAEAVKKSATKPPLPTSLPSSLKISHPDRVIDTSTGTSKIQLIRFYGVVAPLMMSHLKGRPVALMRAPGGIHGELFFQKHMERVQMDGIESLDSLLDQNHPPYLEVVRPEGLLSAAQMNVIEFHTWNAVKTAIGKPDRMTFDLDPGTGVQWPLIPESSLLIRNFLTQLGLVSFVKTSGGKGMHVVVPIKPYYDWDTVKDFSHAIVQHLAQTLPQRFVALSGPRNRVGKIFIDYLRNGFGATTVCAWSARAREGMGVSVPLAWTEVESLRASDQWNVGNIHSRLDQGNAPWKDYKSTFQGLTAAMKILGFKPAKRSKK